MYLKSLQIQNGVKSLVNKGFAGFGTMIIHHFYTNLMEPDIYIEERWSRN